MRKTSISRANLVIGNGKIVINNKDVLEYFNYNPRCE